MRHSFYNRKILFQNYFLVGTVKVEDLYELFYVSVVRLGAGYYVFIP